MFEPLESDASGISVTIEKYSCYPELVDYLENKYGFDYGSRTNPISIEEDIWVGESFANLVGVGQVKYLSIMNTQSSVGINLYLSNYRDTYYCVALNNYRVADIFGIATEYFWD